MATPPDGTTTGCPAFRKDLEVVPRLVGEGRMRYLVRDPQTDEVFEFGAEEYALCALLDGQTMPPDILAAFRRQSPCALELQELEAFLRKIARLGLLASPPGETAASRRARAHSSAMHEAVLVQRPNKWLDGLLFAFGWCAGGLFTPILLLSSILAAAIAIVHFNGFLARIHYFHQHYGGGIFLLGPLFGILVILPVSELTKALCCRRLRGNVSDFRLRIYFRFLPVLIAGMRDALWFMRQQERRLVLTAGLKSQILIWAGATIAWQQSEPWSPLQMALSFLCVAAFFILLMNLNPLAQKDGYALLVSSWETENLKERAERFFKSRILGHPLPEPLGARQKSRFCWYGLASLLFRSLILIAFLGVLGYGLIDLLQGVGAILFSLILFSRFETTIRRVGLRMPLLRHLMMCEVGKVRVQFLAKIGLLILFCLVLVLPYPFEVGGEFEVLPASQFGIRAEIPGMIKEVLVQEDQGVKPGQLLASLDDRLQRTKVEVLRASLAEAKALLTLRRKGAKPEEIEKARQEVETAAGAVKFSEQEARRYRNMYEEKAVPETEYQHVLRREALDRENLELARKNLAVVQSGAREEELKALEAEVQRLQVELAHAEEDLRHTVLVSPLEGRLVTPYLKQKVGQRLEVGELFATVESTAGYIAEIEVPEEDVSEIRPEAKVRFRTWSNPHRTVVGRVTFIAPATYEKSLQSRDLSDRVLSQRESLAGQKEILRERGKVLRVLAEFPSEGGLVRSNMTGYAKIECGDKPVAIAFTRWLVRLVYVEVWSWIP